MLVGSLWDNNTLARQKLSKIPPMCVIVFFFQRQAGLIPNRFLALSFENRFILTSHRYKRISLILTYTMHLTSQIYIFPFNYPSWLPDPITPFSFNFLPFWYDFFHLHRPWLVFKYTMVLAHFLLLDYQLVSSGEQNPGLYLVSLILLLWINIIPVLVAMVYPSEQRHSRSYNVAASNRLWKGVELGL